MLTDHWFDGPSVEVFGEDQSLDLADDYDDLPSLHETVAARRIDRPSRELDEVDGSLDRHDHSVDLEDLSEDTKDHSKTVDGRAFDVEVLE